METKRFTGAPFGIQMARFDVSGIHPRIKIPGTFTEVSYDLKSTNLKVLNGYLAVKKAGEVNLRYTGVVSRGVTVISAASRHGNRDKLRTEMSQFWLPQCNWTRQRGPGMYQPDHQGFHPIAVEKRASGPGWAREQEVKSVAAMPQLMHKALFEEKRELKRKLGPGSYNFKDFIQHLKEKPGSILGICEPRASRFGKDIYTFTPGPGTYGKNGIPHTVLEEKAKKSASTKGMLDNFSGSRFNIPGGCPLGPGTYSFVDSIDKIVSKVVSIRGPYDLFSSDRSKPITTGHFAAPRYGNLAPGQYETKSLFDEWSGEHKKHKGKFGKVAQYPRPPTERIFNSVLSQCPKEQYFPGPGAHSPSCPGDWPRVRNYRRPAFLSSSDRMDRRAQRFFTGNFNSVGVGRYEIRNFQDAQHRSGHQNVFKSKGARSSYPSDHFLKERIRGKDVPVAERSSPTYPQGLPSEEKPRHMYSFRHQIVLCKLLRRHQCQAVGALALPLDYISDVERGDPLHGQQLVSLIPFAQECVLESTLESWLFESQIHGHS